MSKPRRARRIIIKPDKHTRLPPSFPQGKRFKGDPERKPRRKS